MHKDRKPYNFRECQAVSLSYYVKYSKENVVNIVRNLKNNLQSKKSIDGVYTLPSKHWIYLNSWRGIRVMQQKD